VGAQPQPQPHAPDKVLRIHEQTHVKLVAEHSGVSRLLRMLGGPEPLTLPALGAPRPSAPSSPASSPPRPRLWRWHYQAVGAQGPANFDHNRELQHAADVLHHLTRLYARCHGPCMWAQCCTVAGVPVRQLMLAAATDRNSLVLLALGAGRASSRSGGGTSGGGGTSDSASASGPNSPGAGGVGGIVA
jgi:hypothetical protein